MHQIRFYHPDLIFEVSRRVINGEFLFDPTNSPQIGPAFHAIIARAQKEHGITVYAYFVLSNHYHGLFQASTADSLADFLRDVHADMARFANRLHERSGPVFSGRAHVKPVNPDEASVTSRLAYIMGQAIKIENSPWTIESWPGANTNTALMYGESIVGTYLDKHRKDLESRRKAGPQADEHYTSHPQVELSVLPFWKNRPPHEQRAAYQAIAVQSMDRFGQLAPNRQQRNYTSETSKCPEGDGQEGASVACEPKPMHQPNDVPIPSSGAVSCINHGPKAAPISALGNDPGCAANPDSPTPREPRPNVPPTNLQRRPKPKKGGRVKAHFIHAARKEDEDAFCELYLSICQQHYEAKKELLAQARQLVVGAQAKLVAFPAYTFACAVRIGDLRQELNVADLPLTP